MTNYSRILDTLENNVKELQIEKDNAQREKEKALYEVKMVRQRYQNIVGAE